MKKTTLFNVACWSILLMFVTSVHHWYGAYAYNTPWRLHVLFISIPVTAVTALLYFYLAMQPANKIAAWAFWLITLIPSLLMIGVFEGVYNHALKNLLYFAGAGKQFLDRLYVPGVYELPNDFWFESTGVLQAVIVYPLAKNFIRLTPWPGTPARRDVI